MPWGARPAVPERPVVKPRPPEHPRDYFGGGDPYAPRIIDTPQGRYMVTPGHGHAGGAASVYAPAGPRVRGTMIPAVPANQEVCVVGGFDPSWGTPPETVRGLALPFDASIGAYRFDPAYTHARTNLDVDLLARRQFDELRRMWEQHGQALQPFKRPGSTRWEYRWVPNTQSVHCFGSEAELRAHQQQTLAAPSPQKSGGSLYTEGHGVPGDATKIILRR